MADRFRRSREDLRWLKPARAGGTPRLRVEVVESRPLQSRPGLGVVKKRWEKFNQRRGVVRRREGAGFILRREPG